MFLMGPAKQCKNMFDQGRIYATLTYLGAIAATLAVAFTLSGVAGFALVIVFLVIQFVAFAYYAMTYIPGGACEARLFARWFWGGAFMRAGAALTHTRHSTHT